MTHELHLHQQAILAEARTSTNNKPIAVVYKKQLRENSLKYNYSMISHLLQMDTVTKSVIKFALSYYEPVNSLEYE